STLCELFGVMLFTRLASVRRSASCLFRSGQLYQFVKIKCPTPIRSNFSKIDLIPPVHSDHSVAFFPDAHRFAHDHPVDNFLVFGAGPASLPAPSPIDPLPDIVVSFRTLLKVEKGARVSSENCGNVLRRAQIANLSNAPPKRDQSFRRNCTQAEYSTIAQLPKRSADVRGERISAERMDRDSPAAA